MTALQTTSNLFDDDDQETQYLVINASADQDLSSRLKSLGQRFKEDHDRPDLAAQWRGWEETVKADGFRLVVNSTKGSVAAVTTSASLPDAFKLEDGKKHLIATKTLLGLKSEQRAGQLTMCALRNMKDIKNLQALLGTRRLVMMVMEYYYKQRSTRIEILAELLRQEQDERGAIAASGSKVLEELDSSHDMNGKDRGLFKYLVSISCRSLDGQVLSRDQLAKSRELKAGTPTTLRESIHQPSGDKSWHQFVAKCLNSTRNSIHEERIRAMEALVALLYTRIEGGVSRVDYMILLKAFQSADAFFTTGVESEKLSQLAGLVCAECMGLWRVFADDDPTNVVWVQSHPLLEGLGPSPSQAETELMTLKSYLERLPEHNKGMAKQKRTEPRRSVPESMAFLSLGLLMMMTYEAILQSDSGTDSNGCWQVFHEQGQDLVMVASSFLAAFDVFHDIMTSLVIDPRQSSSDKQRSDLPYDWLLLGMSKSTPTEISDGSDGIGADMDGASLINASIGTEIVSSIICAFGDSILSPLHENFLENLSMICDLAASIYRCSPSLCTRFWVDWDQYTAPENQPPMCKWPLCKIVDLAFSVVNDTVSKGRLDDKEQVLSSFSPLLQLLASLCYSAERVEGAFAVLRPTMLQKALAFCAADADAHSNERFQQNRLRFLSSLSAMARLGTSTSCRNTMRETLGMSTPSILFKVLASSDAKCRELALQVASSLLNEAPVEWIISFGRGIETLVSQNTFGGSEELFYLARIFNALAMSFPLVVFAEHISDLDIQHFLDMIWRGVLQLSPVLPLCLSNVTTESVPLKTVTSILDFFGSLLENIGATAASRRTVSERAMQMRKALVELMSSHMGEALMFYTLLPLSLSIGYSIESYAEERHILESASMQESNLGNKYGAWHATATYGALSPTKQSETQTQLVDLVADAAANLEKVPEYSREDFQEIVLCVSKAMGILRLWAIHAEAIATGEVDTTIEQVAGLTHEQREQLSSLSPSKLLFFTAALPNPMRAKGKVKALFESVSPSNFELLTKYINVDVWPFNLSAVSMDILHACISHMKLGSIQGTLKDAVERSDFFGLLSPVAVGGADTTGNNTATRAAESRETRIRSILAFRLASVTLEVLLAVDDIVGKEGSKMMKAAFGGVERACNNLHQFREGKNRLSLRSENMLDDLLAGTACLCFLSSVWNDANRLDGPLKLTNEYDAESGAFRGLAKVLLQHARSESEIEPAASGCLYCFLAGAVQYLKLATELALTREQIKTCSVMVMMKENSLQLLSMPQKFLMLSSIASTTVPQTLLAQFPVVAVSGDPSLFFNVDVTLMDASINDGKDKLFKMALSHYSFTSQVQLQSQWKQFADILLQISSQGQPSSLVGRGTLVTGSADRSDKYLLAALEVLRVIAENAANIESAAVDGAALTIQDIAQMAESTGTVLVLLSASNVSEAKHNPDALTELLGLTSFCAAKLFNILETSAEVCCRVEQNLLTAACLILMSEPVLPSEVVDQLVQVIHSLLQLLEMKTTGSTECLNTIVVLLTLLLAARGAGFVEGNLVHLLVRQANAYSRSGEDEEEKIQVLVSIVDFFSSLASASEEMLELLGNGALQQLLTRNPILERARRGWGMPDTNTPSAKLRGYIPTKEPLALASQKSTKSTSFFSGKNDPQHVFWRAALKCFRTFCRSAREAPSKKERFESLTSDFILTHRQMMLACLKTIESTAFTKNTLQEATLILALLAEFCSRPCRDGRTVQLIATAFIPESLRLVSRLANFLGASSASRELFGSMGDSDSSDDSQLDHSWFNRVPHNARHEAIRYSHYASKFCTAVTTEEISESSSVKGKGLSDPRDQSATALEKHGKAQMSSDFARTMELCAAECLFAALSLLWEQHPVNQSFVVFEQGSRIDAMRLVKPGMVIGYVSDQESQRPWGMGYVHFAEVLAVNTIDKSLYVRSLLETGESEIVKANQIVGMEDISKRRCVLRFAAAADSATDLENNSHSVSMGHLVLILRWCSTCSKPPAAVGRLTGLVSCFLGAEMEIHKLLGSPLSMSKSKEPEKLYAQLLELFGTKGSFAGSGRLKGMLDQKSWATIRKQLKDELKAADEARANDAMILEDEELFLRNSSGRNPFHDLRMHYQ